VLYILSAAETGAGEAAESFVVRVVDRVTQFHPVSVLRSPSAIGLAHVGPDDGVAFVIGDPPTDEALDFLRRATDTGAVVLPIALDAENRRPPDEAGAAQSFDVLDALRRAGIPPQQIDWAAREFSRVALARLAPTCFRNRLRIFLSYRRDDGEGLTADLDRDRGRVLRKVPGLGGRVRDHELRGARHGARGAGAGGGGRLVHRPL